MRVDLARNQSVTGSMEDIERDKIVTLLARIGGEMEDASAVAARAAGLDDQGLVLAVVAVQQSIDIIQRMASKLW